MQAASSSLSDGVGLTQVESGLSKEDHQLLSGALDYKDKRVKDVMTPIERVYSFEASVRLNFATMMEIYKSGTLLSCHIMPSNPLLSYLLSLALIPCCCAMPSGDLLSCHVMP